ncbi:holo-ACP synthase [Mesobacillus subterraneus]|uniref:Holo-[acyl-carrier-protein] synthase n=1 Tax=Mesobacillus subterraneus TaxID=285983 RepID=A0A427TE67_9BACI|nr:holo-ACP synthase [Mesobacillus subterraneus]RSD21145.1 holo-ACP synthase [Mesobacillus subterraneus]
MIIGTGIDIVEIGRISKLVQSQPRFPDRVLTEKEKEVYSRFNERRGMEFLAGRWAAKEAFSKARGTGIGKELSFQDIEVENDPHGRPIITRPYMEGIHLSISHSEQYAIAQVVIEKI